MRQCAVSPSIYKQGGVSAVHVHGQKTQTLGIYPNS
jgi:hypothetical protein